MPSSATLQAEGFPSGPEDTTRQPWRQADSAPNPAPGYRLVWPLRPSPSRPARPVRPHAPARQELRVRADCQAGEARIEIARAGFDSPAPTARVLRLPMRCPLPVMAVTPSLRGAWPSLPARLRARRTTTAAEARDQGVAPGSWPRCARMIAHARFSSKSLLGYFQKSKDFS